MQVTPRSATCCFELGPEQHSIQIGITLPKENQQLKPSRSVVTHKCCSLSLAAWPLEFHPTCNKGKWGNPFTDPYFLKVFKTF
jgi:hypothetical protein